MDQKNKLGFCKRFARLITGRRKTIMLTGYSGSGKTTILTVLDLKRDVTNEDVTKKTSGFIPYYIDYKTKENDSIFIKSVDSGGVPVTVNDKKFDNELKKHHYILYLLNVYAFVYGDKKNSKEYSLSWLQKTYDYAKNNGKAMMLVLSHADEYLHKIGESYSEENKSIIRDLFLSDTGLLSGVEYNCEVEIHDVQKYDEVRMIIDKLIKLNKI